MSSDTFTILTIIFSLIGAILAFSEELSKFTRLKIINNIWFKLTIVLLIAIFTYLATITRNKSEKEELPIEQLKRDSIAELKRVESNSQLITSFGNAIGKYKLHY